MGAAQSSPSNQMIANIKKMKECMKICVKMEMLKNPAMMSMSETDLAAYLKNIMTKQCVGTYGADDDYSKALVHSASCTMAKTLKTCNGSPDIERCIRDAAAKCQRQVSTSARKSVKSPPARKVSKKTSAKKSSVKRSPPKTSPVKTSPIKKSPIKKSPVKTSPLKKSPVKRSPAKKSVKKSSRNK